MSRTTTQTTETSLTFKQVMPAVTKGLGNNLGKHFVEDPTRENADAILDVIRKNLYTLAGVKVAKTPKVAKVETEEEAPKTRTRRPKSKVETVGADKFVAMIAKREDVELERAERRVVREIAKEFDVPLRGDRRVFLKNLIHFVVECSEKKFGSLCEIFAVKDAEDGEDLVRAVMTYTAE